MSGSEPPVPGSGQKLSWQCAVVGLILIAAYAVLTRPLSILDAGGPAGIAIAVAVFAGAISAYGAFRGIDRASFTRPAVLNAVVLALVTPGVVRAWLISHRSSDALNVKRLTEAVSAYAKDNGGQYPSDLGVLFSRPGLSPAAFRRPGSAQAAPASAGDLLNGNCDYIYLVSGPLGTERVPVLCTRPGILGSWINVGYSDITVTGVRADSVELASGVPGLEPAPPPPLPTMKELKARRAETKKNRQKELRGDPAPAE